MKRWLIALICILVAGCGAMALAHPHDRYVYDLAKGRETAMPLILAESKERQVILVGEYHSVKAHHDAQLAVIKTLKDAGVVVAVGLEMFRQDSQKSLDAWVAGRTPETEFKKIYADNWNYPWAAYRDIFVYARNNGLPMVGLNVPRAITRQVARKGFQSLSQAQKGKLSNVTCRVDKAYMDFIRRAFGDHGHGNINFNYFCEAQLLWDNVMAVAALDYIETHPGSAMVVLTGTGHARKPGVPAQIRKRSDVPVRVFLPEVPGRIDPRSIDETEADYIILGPRKE